MAQNDNEERRERELRHQAIDYWKATAAAIKSGNGVLQKEARRESIRMIEDAARTTKDFVRVSYIWDEVERIESWRVDKHEENYDAELPDYELTDLDVVIPPPLDYVWWRQLMGGEFLDVIHDCPHEIHEFTSSRPVYDFTKELDENHKEILYYWAIRLWSPQRIAAHREQSDRNIRKVYNKMIEDIRRKIFNRLYPRYEEFLPLTLAQIKFVEEYIVKHGKGKIRKEIDVDDEPDK